MNMEHKPVRGDMDVATSRLRRALPQDALAVAACVQAAYAYWVPKLGRKPWPMLQDYEQVLAAEHVVLAEEGGDIAGILVLCESVAMKKAVRTTPKKR